jgi:hypothetical protein
MKIKGVKYQESNIGLNKSLITYVKAIKQLQQKVEEK